MIARAIAHLNRLEEQAIFEETLDGVKERDELSRLAWGELDEAGTRMTRDI